MFARQPTIECTACHQPNPANGVYCAWCGAALPVVDTLGDPGANGVAGAPVSAPASQPYNRLLDIQGRLPLLSEEIRSRAQQVLPEVSASLNESLSRLTALAQTISPRPQSAKALHLTQAQRHGLVRQTQTIQPAPPIPIRMLWCVVIGLWVMPFWIIGTWLATCTIIGLPLAERMLDLAPTVFSLHSSQEAVDQWRYRRPLWPPMQPTTPQLNLSTRALYFLFVGCWASLLWLFAATCLTLTKVGRPTGHQMFEVAPNIAHLERR